MTIRFIKAWPGEFHVGLWVTRRAWSVRLGWWALIWKRS